jgi:hypothetical protein
MIPRSLDVVCAGIEFQETVLRLGEDYAREIAALSGLYSLRLRAFERALRTDDARTSMSDPVVSSNGRFTPRLLSTETRLYTIDFQHRIEDLRIGGEVEMNINVAGLLRGIVLYFHAHLDEVISLSNAPELPRSSWSWAIRPFRTPRSVSAGERVRLRFSRVTVEGRDRTSVDLA